MHVVRTFTKLTSPENAQTVGENAVTAVALRRQVERRDWQSSSVGHFARSLAETIRVSAPEISPPSTATEPSWVAPTRARMLELQRLPDNRDGRGSSEVRGDALSFAGSMLSSIMPPTAPAPAIVPLGHGGMQLIWQNAAVEIEVEVVGPNNVITYCFDRATGREVEERLTVISLSLRVSFRRSFRPSATRRYK